MKYNNLIFLILIFFSFIGCGDTPVFTELSGNRLKVVIKGTFETEDVSHFTAMNGQDPNVSPVEDTNSVDDVTSGSHDVLPETFMLDIAEIRLDGKKFANYRTVIEASLAGGNTKASEPEPFFNGDGVILRNDDPGDGTYNTVQLYIRKMVFDNAMIYQSTGSTLTYEKPAEVIFHENDVNGFDFNQLQVNSYWDSLRLEASDTLRIFPLEVPIIGSLVYDKQNEETVLEIRLVIKNFVKKYEYDYYDEGVFKVSHYYALSDWLRDVRAGENDIGRNIHAVARTYVPGKTGIISDTSPGIGYVIAIPSGDSITDYTISATGSALRTANVCDLPQGPSYPGEYIEAILDYYLKYEKYKFDFNAKIASCPNFETGTPNYTDEWNSYEAEVDNFKIAPYAIYSDGTGNYIFNNVAQGSYDIYWASVPAYGELFIDGAFTSLGTVTNLLAGETKAPL